jgi:hypothetical protein
VVFLLFFNGLQFIGFLSRIGLAYRKAVLEEELLASEDGFGKDYSNYMFRMELIGALVLVGSLALIG